MANIPTGVIYIWTGTHASIPSGWERVTALDGKFIKGTADATNPGTSGGNATHSHTSSSHTHTLDAHTHTITLPSATGSQTSNNASVGTGVVGRLHSHNAFTSGAISSSSIGSTAVTYASVSNNPPYYEVIFITATSGSDTIPNGVVYLYEGSDSKTGHYICDGNNSTPSLNDKYLRGATASGNAGGTGGSTQNVHGIDHSHTVSHDHASATSGGATSGFAQSSNETVPAYGHTHAVSLASDSTGTGTSDIDLTTSETVEPAYTKLLAVQNRTGHGDARIGMIGMWLGTLANIPSNYELTSTDMKGRHLKLTATASEIGNTGGSNTHTHASQGHTHTGIAHTHTFAQQSHSATNNVGDGSTGYPDSASVVHASGTSGSTNYSLASGNTSADSSSNEPEYRTVAFIKLKSLSAGGAFLLNML